MEQMLKTKHIVFVILSKQKIDKRVQLYTQKSSYTLATILKISKGCRNWDQKDPGTNVNSQQLSLGISANHSEPKTG